MSDQTPDPHDEILRNALRAEVQDVTAGHELLERIRAEGAAQPPAARRRAPWLLVAAAAVAVIGLAAALSANGGDDGQQVDVVDDPTLPEDLPDPAGIVACLPGEEFDLAVYLLPDASADDVTSVGQELEATGVEMRYVGRDETFERFQQLFADEEGLLATVTPDILPTSYLLDLDQPADEVEVRAALAGSSSVYDIVAVECEVATTDMFDLLSSTFPCEDGHQTVFFLSPTATAAESEAVETSLQTNARVRSFRFISTDEVAAALEAAAPEASWEPASIPTAYLATSDTEADDLAVRGEVSDLAGITGISSTDCTDPPVEPTSERPTVVALVREDGWLGTVDLQSGEQTELHFGGDPDVILDEPAGSRSFIDDVELSPDGQWVYFSTCCEPASGNTYRIPISGGEPELFAVGGGPRLSPDGRFLATSAAGYGIIVTRVDKSAGGAVSLELDCCTSRLAWSPSGKHLAVVRGETRDHPGLAELLDWDGATLSPAHTERPGDPAAFLAWTAAGGVTISSGRPVDDDRGMRQDASFEWTLWVDEEGVIREQAGFESSDRTPIAGLPEALVADW